MTFSCISESCFQAAKHRMSLPSCCFISLILSERLSLMIVVLVKSLFLNFWTWPKSWSQDLFYLRLLKLIALSIRGRLYRWSKMGYRFSNIFSVNNHNDLSTPN